MRPLDVLLPDDATGFPTEDHYESMAECRRFGPPVYLEPMLVQ